MKRLAKALPPDSSNHPEKKRISSRGARLLACAAKSEAQEVSHSPGPPGRHTRSGAARQPNYRRASIIGASQSPSNTPKTRVSPRRNSSRTVPSTVVAETVPVSPRLAAENRRDGRSIVSVKSNSVQRQAAPKSPHLHHEAAVLSRLLGSGQKSGRCQVCSVLLQLLMAAFLCPSGVFHLHWYVLLNMSCS